MKIINKNEGYTIIEVILGILILSVVIIPMLSTLVGSHNIVYLGRDYMIANNLVTQAAEETKALPYENINSDILSGYGGSKFTLVKAVYSLPSQNSTLKQVYLYIKDNSKNYAEASFILYKKGL